jgi:3-hydroxyisobutyrate dehydrogenase-like beta-hydroxyacid dehydrogenase
MTLRTIGIHSPGDMGGVVAQVLAQHGLRPIAALAGRSARTRALAAQAGVEDVGALPTLVREADAILSILVPEQALAAAREVAAAMRAAGTGRSAPGGRLPLYVDCNAISAATALEVGAVLAAAGAPYVDASIIGPPPRVAGKTRFYASGAAAADFAALNAYGLDIRVLPGPIGQASALKTCYASLTKGLNALGATLFTYAHAQGLQGALLEELQVSQPALLAWLQRSLPTVPPKAFRFVGEMEEHGKGFAAAGLPGDMMQGAAELYRFVAATPLGQERPESRGERGLDDVAAALAAALAETRDKP